MKAIRIFLFDVDGPIYRGHMIVDFSVFLAKKGLFDEKALAGMHETVKRYKHHRLAYKHVITGALKAYAKGVRGQSENRIRQEAKRYIRQFRSSVYPESVRRLRRLKKTARVGLVSLSPLECVQELERLIGIRFDYTYGTIFGVKHGRFDGTRKAHNPVDIKIVEIRKALKRFRVAPADAVFFGDTITDRHSAHAAGVHFKPMHSDRELRLYEREMKEQKKKKKKTGK
ncbi:MAG: HAD family hydrolase [Candidatus Diapherotrites archaeon]|nr:HAD family hydrolase [Candidatus Diapherotrites archaeon]